MTSTLHPLLPADPYQVTCPSGRTAMWIGYHSDVAAPIGLALMATTAADRVAIRLAGGCKGLDDAMKRELIDYVVTAMQGYRGMIFSGGTRDVKNGAVDPMVTDVAVAVRRANPDTVLLGSLPRTKGTFGLVEQSRFVIGEYDTAPNPSYDGIYIVQNGVEDELDWDGDLPKYFSLFQQLMTNARFRAVGVIAANGGAVTASEITLSARLGYPTILINGFDRETDRIAAEYRAGKLDWLPDNHQLVVVDRHDPQTLRDALVAAGFLGR